MWTARDLLKGWLSCWQVTASLCQTSRSCVVYCMSVHSQMFFCPSMKYDSLTLSTGRKEALTTASLKGNIIISYSSTNHTNIKQIRDALHWMDLIAQRWVSHIYANSDTAKAASIHNFAFIMNLDLMLRYSHSPRQTGTTVRKNNL